MESGELVDFVRVDPGINPERSQTPLPAHYRVRQRPLAGAPSARLRTTRSEQHPDSDQSPRPIAASRYARKTRDGRSAAAARTRVALHLRLHQLEELFANAF